MSAWQTIAELLRILLIMSTAGSAIALFLFALKPFVKDRIPKAVQYYLWILVLIALLVPFSIFVSIPVATPMSSVQEMIAGNIKTNSERYEEISQKQYNMPFEDLEAEKQVRVLYESKGWFNNWLLAAPITFGATSLLITIFQYMFFLWKLQRSRIPAKKSETAMLSRLNKGKCRPRLYRNPLAPTPMLIGILRPVIILPDRQYSEIQLQNILLHEFTHLQRHDIIIKWLSVLAGELHWFNPIVYLVRREIDRACELACDEAVIKSLDTAGKQNYGNTLIEMVADAKAPKTVLSTTMCEEKKALKERLSAIMKSRSFTRKALAVSSIFFVFILCATVLLGASGLKESAADALFQELRNEAAVVRPESVIQQVNLDDGSILIFYYNANRNLGCAIVERGIFDYKVIKTGAELAVESTAPVSVMAGHYNNANNWRVWGILRDNSITKALIYAQEANIIESDGLRLFYIIGDGRMPDNDDFKFFDAAGSLVWKIP